MSRFVENEPLAILVVDDETYILRSMRRLFIDEENFDIITASSGQEALRVLENRHNIFLIISDMCMPGMNGVELFEKTRKIVPDAMRVLLTGYSDITNAVTAINKGGVHRYITKPWSEVELNEIIKEALEKYNSIKEKERLESLIKRQNEQLREWNFNLAKNVKEKTGKISKRYNTLKESFNELIFAIGGLTGFYDKRLENHSRNVAFVSVKIAERMNLSFEEIEDIRLASLLHDTGKIGLAHFVFNKSIEELDGENLEEYKSHTLRGEMLVGQVKVLQRAGILIRHHHEHFDGTGFPDGLKGIGIPLGARIIALVNYVDNIIRGGNIFMENIMKELTESREGWFDPQLLEFMTSPVKQLYGSFLID